MTPFATRRAEEAKTRQAARCTIVAQGRALVEGATREKWDPPRVARDSRYLDLRPQLPANVRETYSEHPNMLTRMRGRAPPTRNFADAIDVLEREWKLI